MAIITVSRQLGSLGSEIAHRLSLAMECEILTRDSFEEALEEHGLSREDIHKFDERKPRIRDRLSARASQYRRLLSRAMYEHSLERDCIVLGRGGHAVLGKLGNALNARVVCSMETRIGRVMQRYECNRGDAVRRIKKSDHDRTAFHHFFFHTDWADVADYDVVVNTTRLTVEAATVSILQAFRAAHLREHDHEANSRLGDLLLEEKILSTVLEATGIPTSVLYVTVKDGVATLTGDVALETKIRHCETLAKDIEGVDRVEVELVHTPQFRELI